MKKSGTKISIDNAGIVLLNNYIPQLFDRLVLLKDGEFRTAAAQLQAVHCLQFMVSGTEAEKESNIQLNNALCGLPLSQPLQRGVVISGEQKKLMDNVLKSVINHWPEVGPLSVNAFRESWIQRPGSLTEHEDHFDLTVENKPYDKLLNTAPFSFSIIRLSWMEKPIHVNWSY